MRRGEAAFEQQTHRIAFITETRLHRDQQVAKLVAEYKNRFAVGQEFAGRRAPMRFDIGQVALAAHMVFGRNEGMHIRVRTVLHAVAFQNTLLQCFA